MLQRSLARITVVYPRAMFHGKHDHGHHHHKHDHGHKNDNGHKLDHGEQPLNVKEAQIGHNVHPVHIKPEQITSNSDPDTMLKKEQNLEFRDLPKDGKHDEKTYHVMKSLDPFPNTDNDISKEYGLKVKGLEPTRFGDWERKGRCTDF